MFVSCMPYTEFGSGAVELLGQKAGAFGKNAFVVLDRFLYASGYHEKIKSILEKASVACTFYFDVDPNPDCMKVDAAAALAKDASSDMVIGIGGGSALDFAKGVAILCCNEGACWQYTERSDHEVLRPNHVLPVIALPTTAGTGSEATPFAVFTHYGLKQKSTIVSNAIYPVLTLVDPDLMLTMPPRLTASTGFDAFAHCLEAYMSKKANPFVKMTAVEGMKIAWRYLPEAVKDGQNLEARTMMAWASTLGGTAISRIGVTLPHSMGQAAGGMFGIPHGESVAACTVEILNRSWQSAVGIFSEIYDALAPGSNLSKVQKAEECASLIQSFLNAIELSVHYSHYGMKEADIDTAAKLADTCYYFDIQCHPVLVTAEDIKAIYRVCL